MINFDENSELGKRIMKSFEISLWQMELFYKIKFKDPFPDISRRLLNEINEFKALKEVK